MAWDYRTSTSVLAPKGKTNNITTGSEQLNIPEHHRALVHLTSQQNVARIRKNGLRLGNGRWGRGIYAVPLFYLPTEHKKDGGDSSTIRFEGSGLSSSGLWDFKFRDLLGPKRHWAAVVFTIPQDCWPIDLCLEMYEAEAKTFLRKVPSQPSRWYDEPQVFESNQGFSLLTLKMIQIYTFRFGVHGPKGIGSLLHDYFAAGGGVGAFGVFTPEVVVHAKTPAHNIERIVPFYKTIKERKSLLVRKRGSKDDD